MIQHCAICGWDDEYVEPWRDRWAHTDCAKEAEGLDVALEYAEAYPISFFRYLRDQLYENTDEGAALATLLTDYKERSEAKRTFSGWYGDN